MTEHHSVSHNTSTIRVKTEELLHLLDSLPFSQLPQALRNKRTIFPEEFTSLLSRHYFFTAVQYQALDRSREQAILTDKGTFEGVLETVR